MSSLNDDVKPIKTLAEWPLSKVELIEIEGKKYVRKTVHSDFKDEFERQQFLFKNLKYTKVPQIYDITSRDNSAICLMEYVEIDREATTHEAVELLMDFQGECKNLSHESFPVYGFEEFKSDLEVAKQYGADINANDFAAIFESDSVINHGDFGTDQMVIDKNSKLYLLDFGRSFIGPGILDFAYFARGGEEQEKKVRQTYGVKDEYFNQAKTIVAIRQIAWFHLCQTKYYPVHDYINIEIKKELKHLASLQNS